MCPDFPRILTLLRKEKGISQKSAAAQLAISQALLSHYEKGIRECGLDFLVRCADFYGVSGDDLLGRAPDRQGSTLTVEDIPEPDISGRENRAIGSVLPVLNKKLLSNSLAVLFDLLARAGNKHLTGEVSAFLSLAVYRMFRVVHGANPKNQDAMFSVPKILYSWYSDSAMQIGEANAVALVSGLPPAGMEALKDPEPLSLSTESLAQQYPLYASSLLNLIQNAEMRIERKERPGR